MEGLAAGHPVPRIASQKLLESALARSYQVCTVLPVRLSLRVLDFVLPYLGELASNQYQQHNHNFASQDVDAFSSLLSFKLIGEAQLPLTVDNIASLDFLGMSYAVKWPLNIVVDDEVLGMYNKV